MWGAKSFFVEPRHECGDGTVALTGDLDVLSANTDVGLERHLDVPAGALGHLVIDQRQRLLEIDEARVEGVVDLLRRDFLASGIGDLLHDLREFSLAVLRHGDAVLRLQKVRDATLAALAVDPNDGLVLPADVMGIDGQVRHLPNLVAQGFKALLDGVLVRTGESRVDQAAGPRVALGYLEFGAELSDLDRLVELVVDDLGVDALGKQVQRQGHEADVAGALAVAEQATLHPVRTRHERELCRGDAGAAVIVGMQTNAHAVTSRDVSAHPLDLVGIDVGCGHLHSARKVQDDLVLRSGPPDVADGLAHFQREIQLRTGEALRRVLQTDVHALQLLLCQLLQQLCALNSHFLDVIALSLEHHAALQLRSGVVYMENDVLGTSDALDGALDQRLSGLREHLNVDVVRDEPVVDNVPDEIEVCLARSWEPNLDLLVTDLDEVHEQAQLLLMIHGVDQSLVAVSEIHRAPARGLLDFLAGPCPRGPLLVERDRVPRREVAVLINRHLATSETCLAARSELTSLGHQLLIFRHGFPLEQNRGSSRMMSMGRWATRAD
mmetsp:Transcript_83702/g.235243  ORF Transcript_83702/g.235243 Transcript_83702/m.235243 type:complete len:552 (-) Transcript_83702:3-1658(-)